MKQINVDDMIGYKSPAAKMKTNTIDKLIGVKTASYDSLPRLESGSKSADFELKMDKHVNTTPYDMHKLPRNTDETVKVRQLREERAYSMIGHFVPGYRQAGKWHTKLGASLGIKSSKRKLAIQKRHHVVNHIAGQAGELVKNQRPDIDPNLVDMGTMVAGGAANMGIDAGVNKVKSIKAKIAAKKEAKRKLHAGE